MQNAKFLVGVCLLIILHACQQKATESDVEDLNFNQITLENMNGEKLSAGLLLSNSHSILYFLSPECPLCQNYSVEMKKIAELYSSDSIQMIGIFPGNYYSRREIMAYLIKYGLKLEVFIDPNNDLCKKLGASITPEVFVLNNKAEIEYQGAIDNWAVSLGRKRTVTTKFYLKDALYALTNGEEIKTKKTEAVGCLIEL